MPSKWVKRLHYRNFPHDIRPSHVAGFMAHGPGTVVEVVAPLTLLLSPWPWLTIIAAAIMVAFHLFIISTFPLAVPLEWNVLFAYATIFLFLGFPNWEGYSIADMSSPWLTVAILAGLLFFPVLGNLRPDLVSFLPSMRQYAGNWASAVWAFAPGAEEKLNRVTRSARNQVDQLVAFGYEPQWAEISMQQPIAWRSMHSQGRGLFSVLLKNLRDIDTRTVREAEFVCNSLIGFNFGDGHLHNEDLIKAVQDEAAVRARRAGRGLGRVAGHRKQGSALQGHRRGARRDRARYVEGGRRCGRTAVAAERPDPLGRDVDPPYN